MADDKIPDSKPTVAFAAPPPWAIEMMTAVKSGFAATSARADDFEQHLSKQDNVLEQQNGVLGRVATESVESNTRLTRLEAGHSLILGRVDALENRATNNSMKVTAVSNHDLEADAKLAETIVKTQTLETAILETQTMMKQQNKLFGIDRKTVTEWLRSPNFKRDVATIFVALATGYTAFKEVIHR